MNPPAAPRIFDSAFGTCGNRRCYPHRGDGYHPGQHRRAYQTDHDQPNRIVYSFLFRSTSHWSSLDRGPAIRLPYRQQAVEASAHTRFDDFRQERPYSALYRFLYCRHDSDTPGFLSLYIHFYNL